MNKLVTMSRGDLVLVTAEVRHRPVVPGKNDGLTPLTEDSAAYLVIIGFFPFW